MIYYPVLAVLLSGLWGCNMFKSQETQIREVVKKEAVRVDFGLFKAPSGNLSLVKIGERAAVGVFFIHGAPGDMGAFKKYFTDSLLLEKAQLFAVDRLGYGQSSDGLSAEKIKNQAEILIQLVEKLQISEVILVGHSYGGPVAVRMAMDAPDLNIRRVILLAPALDPDHEKMFWVNRPLSNAWAQKLLPRGLAMANREKMVHAAELQKMLPLWKGLQAPITMIHGTKDALVPYENVAFIKRHYQGEALEVISLNGENHFIPWTKYALVRDTILKYIQ
ncbi:alpha/beta hydrolase [Persicobacter psychrovividus]|uniref:Alpha/beta hydrolase n=2 Tax=Persicobacter psychrovividus TaxID=387638 RepID=A0ABN6L8E6_9BACT|nr:alpha/beta hydrolase [Persicobacter psychrovividus]